MISGPIEKISESERKKFRIQKLSISKERLRKMRISKISLIELERIQRNIVKSNLEKKLKQSFGDSINHIAKIWVLY